MKLTCILTRDGTLNFCVLGRCSIQVSYLTRACLHFFQMVNHSSLWIQMLSLLRLLWWIAKGIIVRVSTYFFLSTIINRYPNVVSGNLGCHVNMRNSQGGSGTLTELLNYNSKHSKHSFSIVKTKYDLCNIFCIISNTSLIENRWLILLNCLSVPYVIKYSQMVSY